MADINKSSIELITNRTSNTVSTDTNATTITISTGEKTLFERAIIEAFKATTSTEIYSKLSIALDEIKFLMKESRSVLNKNILDKLSRIVERKFFNVTILIGKIYENLLDPKHFDILSNDPELLVSFANEVLNLLSTIESTMISHSLEKRCSTYLNYLLNREKLLTDEQKEIIKELLEGFPLRHSSQIYQNFPKEKILSLCKSPSTEDKLEGISLLMESFGSTTSLEEQFDILLEHVQGIVKVIIHQPNPDNKEVYFQLGNFLCSMLYAFKFKIDAVLQYIPQKGSGEGEDVHHDNFGSFYFLKNDKQIKSGNEVLFLHNTYYELTVQADLLLRCENIFQICNLVINTLSIYESIFDLQFVCYIILKRVYFTFPQFRKTIEDTLALTLVNICSFKESYEVETTEECRALLNYLIQNGGDELKGKLVKRIESKKLPAYDVNITDVEYENLRFADFNLRIGYPNSIEIEAGSQISKFIEVHHSNSLIYIGFATSANDITFKLLKYVPSDETKSNEGHFKDILHLDRVDSSINPVKIVMFVQEPGTYKLIFDNSYSWFTGKNLRYRLSVMKPISAIDLDREVTIVDTSKQKKPKHPHGNKILMVKYLGHNRAFNIGSIMMQQEESPSKIIIPVLLSRNSIRVHRRVTDEHGKDHSEYQILHNDDNGIPPEEYGSIFESKLTNYIEGVSQHKERQIHVNILLIEKEIVPLEKRGIPVTSNEKYKMVFNKVGFFPEKLQNTFKNLEITSNNIGDSCLLYILFTKVLKGENFNSIIHIHFDSENAQASLYSEGVIHEKISGLNYDKTKTLMDNMDYVMEFINRVVVLFGEFNLSLSFIENGEAFTETLWKQIQEKDIPVTLIQQNENFIWDVMHNIHLFQ